MRVFLPCLIAAGILIGARTASAHCQVPCGIYDDPARVAAMREDAQTIAKAIAQINELASKHDNLAINQAVRWINTKEQHASNVIDTIAAYFLTQKIKPVAMDADGYDDYLKKLAAHHAVMRAAMTCKQTVDPASAEALSQAIDGIAGYWE
jgi:hypothetical protein